MSKLLPRFKIAVAVLSLCFGKLQLNAGYAATIAVVVSPKMLMLWACG